MTKLEKVKNEKLEKECVDLVRQLLIEFPGFMGADDEINGADLVDRISTYLSLSPEIQNQYDKSDFGK